MSQTLKKRPRVTDLCRTLGYDEAHNRDLRYSTIAWRRNYLATHGKDLCWLRDSQSSNVQAIYLDMAEDFLQADNNRGIFWPQGLGKPRGQKPQFPRDSAQIRHALANLFAVQNFNEILNARKLDHNQSLNSLSFSDTDGSASDEGYTAVQKHSLAVTEYKWNDVLDDGSPGYEPLIVTCGRSPEAPSAPALKSETDAVKQMRTARPSGRISGERNLEKGCGEDLVERPISFASSQYVTSTQDASRFPNTKALVVQPRETNHKASKQPRKGPFASIVTGQKRLASQTFTKSAFVRSSRLRKRDFTQAASAETPSLVTDAEAAGLTKSGLEDPVRLPVISDAGNGHSCDYHIDVDCNQSAGNRGSIDMWEKTTFTPTPSLTKSSLSAASTEPRLGEQCGHTALESVYLPKVRAGLSTEPSVTISNKGGEADFNLERHSSSRHHIPVNLEASQKPGANKVESKAMSPFPLKSMAGKVQYEIIADRTPSLKRYMWTGGSLRDHTIRTVCDYVEAAIERNIRDRIKFELIGKLPNLPPTHIIAKIGRDDEQAFRRMKEMFDEDINENFRLDRAAEFKMLIEPDPGSFRGPMSTPDAQLVKEVMDLDGEHEHTMCW